MGGGTRPKIGVLALQGDVAEHMAMLSRAGARPVAVKHAEQLNEIDGLIIPGGESTTMGKLLRRFEMLEPLQNRARTGFPIYGTCAGMILLADEVLDPGTDQPGIGGMNIAVRRNAFGRQRESFEADVSVKDIGDEPLHAVFIRAPLISRLGSNVEELANINGRSVAARQGNLLVTSFHPELTDDDRMHRYFLSLVEAGRGAAAAR